MAKRKGILRRIIDTIKRFLGLVVDGANDAMDDAVDIETKLIRKEKELLAKKNEITNSQTLMKLRGLAKQTDEELVRARKKQSENKYDKQIRELMARNDKEHARQLLSKKKAEEDNIQRLIEKAKATNEANDKMEKNLNLLDENIEKVQMQLRELRDRNRDAEQTNEIYNLLNEIGDIDMGTDNEGINRAIEERELESFGRQSEFERRNSTVMAQREVNNSSLDDELESYR